MAGRPQTLSEGQRKEVEAILRKRVVTGILVVLAVLTGVTGLSLWKIARRTEQKMETLVARQFEEPRIQTVIREVAAERADSMMLNQVQPEVRRFNAEVDKQLGELQSAVDRATALATPPTLSLSAREVMQTDSGYTATLQFTPSKNEPLGTIVFVASVNNADGVSIVDFWPSKKGGAFGSGKDSKKISPDGRQAKLAYSLLSVGRPTVDIKVTGRCTLKVESNYLADPLTVTVE